MLTIIVLILFIVTKTLGRCALRPSSCPTGDTELKALCNLRV